MAKGDEDQPPETDQVFTPETDELIRDVQMLSHRFTHDPFMFAEPPPFDRRQAPRLRDLLRAFRERLHRRRRP